VFGHYGMTETGLGGGVECEAMEGYHLREADLLFEIVHPVSGEPITDGSRGEVVCTTLTREAMPLVRYRTGDLAAWLPEPCPCSSALQRMGRVAGRLAGETALDGSSRLGLPALDETLFAVPGVTNFRVEIRPPAERPDVWIAVQAASNETLVAVRRALTELPETKSLMDTDRLTVIMDDGGLPAITTAIKRRIIDRRIEERKLNRDDG
jgi:phenylacetate-coenzyme A ligase PaaK-like adenylate-forming protein